MGTHRRLGTRGTRFGTGWLLACSIAMLCILSLLPQGEARADNVLTRKALPESEPSLVTDTTKLNGTNWMSGVSGSLYLHEITIPGTHDAAMWDPFTIGDLFLIQKAGHVFAKTQTLSIKEQLNVGIRLFDLRVTNTYPRSDQSGCYLVHGKVNSGVDWRFYGDMPGKKVLTLDDVLGWVQEFLRAHPTETVILDTSFESDSGYKDESLRQAMVRLQKFGLEINPSTNKTYMHFQNGNIISQMPTLGDVRGQFLVITTDGELTYGMQYPWTPGWAPTTIGGVPFARENHYEADVIEKVLYVDRVYNGGSVAKETFSNPAGGYRQQIPRDASQGVVEQGATVMTSSNRAPGASSPPFVAPRGVADAVNSYYYTLDFFKKGIPYNKQAFKSTKNEPTFVPGRLFGWVYSDYVTEQTSRTLWSTNFPSDLKHVNLTYQITNPATGKTDEKTTVLSGGSIVTLCKSIFGETSDKDYGLLGWEDASGKLIEGDTYQLPSSQNGTVVLKARLALTWHGLQTKINEAKNGDVIVLDRDLTAWGADVSLTIPAGKRLTIDLAGHTLNRNAARTLDGGNVLQLREGSNLILRNGILKGGDAPRGGGALVRKNAKLEAVNVRMENNRAEQRGGGVCVEDGGTFTMLSQDATLPFETNAITSNTCRVGAGVCLEAGGTLRFSGKVNVTGNRLSLWDAAQSNVYLAGTDSIRVDDINDESRIGVSVERVPTSGNPKVISSGNGGAKTSIFSSDDARYTVGLWQAMYHYDATALYSECVVTFDHADGLGTTTDRAAAYNTPVTAPNVPKRSGYTFVEWCSDKECTKPYDFTKPVTSNMTLYAKWGVAQHTVTFDADNGQEPTTVSVAHGQPVDKPTDPTREGHTFLRWAVQRTVLDSNWRPTQEWVAYRFHLPLESDVTLKAQWKIDQPTVTFDANGGSFAGNPATNTTTAQVDYGTAVGRPAAPTREHASLTGWYTDQACTQSYDFGLPVKGDMTLYAGWQLDRREVRFSTFGGTPEPAVQVVGYGEPATKPQDPTREGYAFKGWSTKETELVPYDFGAGVTAPVLNLYAIWDVTVTFDTMDGKTPTTQTVQRGTMLSRPADPEREGYTFAGWYQDVRGRYVPYQFGGISVSGPTRLVARWVPRSYTVSFDTSGGTAVAAQTMGYNAKVSKPGDPSKPGFTLSGWFTDAECTQAYDFNSLVTSDLTLHAGWQASKYTVTLNANGGGFPDETTSKTYENVAHGSVLQGLPGDPIRAGYVFCGWYRDEGCTQPYDLSAPVTGNLGLYAKWEAVRFDAVFVANGGSFEGGGTELVRTVASGTEASTVKPADPTRAGYKFAGWCIDRAGTQTYAFDGAIASDLILYAKWAQVTHTVTFNTGEGSAVAAQTVRHWEQVSVPDDPTRNQQVFCGWYRDEGCAQPYDFTTPVTSDLVLWAKWEEKYVDKYLVAFVTNGGTPAPGTQQVDHGGIATQPTQPQKDGYGFDGWYTADGTEFVFESTSVTSDIILYAKWTPVGRTVTFYANGGSLTGGATSMTYENVAHGSVLQGLPADPTRVGHVFCGWFTRTGDGEPYSYAPYDLSAPVTGDLGLYAKWEAVRFDVVFVANGGTFGDGGTELAQTVPSGTEASSVKPADPTRADCAFAGWYTDQACTQSYDFGGGTTITSDLILYAKWTATVTFDANGGSFAGDPSAVTTTTQVSCGTVVERPATDPTREGYLFVGWHTRSGNEGSYTYVPYDLSAPVTGNLTLYANWTLVEHSATFYANGGSFPGEATSKKQEHIAHGSTLQGPTDGPTRDGYGLSGWCRDADCTQPYDLSTPVTDDLTLFAKWVAEKHTVTFDYGESGAERTTTQVDHDLTVVKPVDPTYENHVFAGWCTRTGSEGSYVYTPYNFDDRVTGDLTLYATWTRQPHYVTFIVDGEATAPTMQVVLHGGYAAQPTDQPQKDGYDFDSWYTADGTKFMFESTPVVRDLVLHARWNSKIFTVTFNTHDAASQTPANQTPNYGRTVIEPAEPTKANHSFQGWFADLDTNLTADEIAQFEALVDGDPESEAYLWLDGTTLRRLYDFEEPVRGDVTLHARWAANEHRVTFVHNDGEATTTAAEVVHNGLVEAQAPEIANTERRLFAGWYRDEACTRPFSLSQPITDDITLYAKWVPKLCNVTFVTCGGSEIAPLPVAAGTIAAPPANPTKDGCRFVGWYTSDDYTDDKRFDVSTTAITADTVLYAKWELLPHAVRFDAEGGRPTPPAQTVQDGELATKPDDPSYDQRTFVGWFADCASGLNDEEVAAIRSELAQDPSLEGVFWLEGDVLRVRCDFDDPVYEDLSLHARWKFKEHTVTFVSDGNEVSAITVSDGKTVSGEDMPWQPGDTDGSQTFAGWFADEALTGVYDFNTPVNDDLTLYASWTINSYTVTFDSEGGSEVSPKSLTVAYGEQIGEPEKPTKHGCTFVGWYEDTGEAVTQAELDDSIDRYITELAAAAETDEDKAAVEEYRKELEDRIWVNNGTAFLRYDFEGDAIFEDAVLHARWNEGTLTTEVVLGNGAPQVTAPNLYDVALKEVTGEEIAQNVLVRLQVDAPSESDMAQQDRDALAATLEDLGCMPGLWLDLSLSKRVGGEDESVQALHETQDPLQLSVEVPASLLSTSADVVRTFYLLRVHDGAVATVAEGTGSTLEGTTDRFSTYLIAYKDDEASPAGAANPSTAQPTAQPNTQSAAQPTASANGTTATQSQQRSSLAQTGDPTSPVLCAVLGLLGAAAAAIAVRIRENARR